MFFWELACHLEWLGKVYIAVLGYTGKELNALAIFIFEYDVVNDEWTHLMDIPREDLHYNVIPHGMYPYRDLVLMVINNGRVVALDLKRRRVHETLDSKFEANFQKTKLNLKFMIPATMNNGADKGLLAANRLDELYYFLDFARPQEGFLLVTDKKDPTIGKSRSFTQTLK